MLDLVQTKSLVDGVIEHLQISLSSIEFWAWEYRASADIFGVQVSMC